MVQRKRSGMARRMVWRITEAAPLGEFVDPDVATEEVVRERDEERNSGGWVVSSFELLNGTDIHEGPDTVPAELFDELFPPMRDTAKAVLKT
jgi:hypothetical protein